MDGKDLNPSSGTPKGGEAPLKTAIPVARVDGVYIRFPGAVGMWTAKLKNRRVAVGKSGDYYKVKFTSLEDKAKRQIHKLDLALSNEAFINLIMLYAKCNQEEVKAEPPA